MIKNYLQIVWTHLRLLLIWVHTVCIAISFQIFMITVKILCIGTDRSQQTVQTKIRLLLKKQSDQDLHCLSIYRHLFEALLHCKIKLFYIKDNYGS